MCVFIYSSLIKLILIGAYKFSCPFAKIENIYILNVFNLIKFHIYIYIYIYIQIEI